MSLSQRIADRRQTDITPLRERRAERSTPRWIRRMTERQLEGKDGLPFKEDTFDVLGRAA